MTESTERVRIGALATRVGVSETVLRAWEMRYQLLDPQRTAAGYRLYGPDDERRARAMLAARERGVPARQAASEILASERVRTHGPTSTAHAAAHGLDVSQAASELEAAMVAYDLGSMHEVIDRAFAAMSVEAAIRDVLLPFMAAVGDGWARGAFDVADEHFASDLVRARLAALSVGAVSRTGPTALLACPPDESHDIALKAFEVVLQRAGWRTRFLGPNTPVSSIVAAAEVIGPDLVVLAAASPVALDLDTEGLRDLSVLTERYDVAVAGSGADASVALRMGARHLAGDPVTAARSLVEERRRRTSH
ncbi:MerR family transcriptional regulator [Nocardioides acrostichi]|uniref:B12-binding domain-containing protein n=1 Tax=Nocardioides acrostichi TaxID=2784339 RepID=A0A930UWE2_9ACTN|nr:B12-binding domain-containing protein [Nocardioides acrostichi]MBF4161381.1 B12-binding domain-containing protein [Nocardioides acrostichi]